MSPDEVRQLQEEYQRQLESDEVDLYDTKGEYSHTEIRQ